METFEPIWLSKNGSNSDVLYLSSVNIVRNIEGYKFVENANFQEKSFVTDMLCNTITKDVVRAFNYDRKYHLPDLDSAELKILRERYILPRKISNYECAYLYTADNEKKSILINEKDHISIRVSDSTVDLFSLYEIAENIEHIFEQNVIFAFDNNFGYLTKSVKNAGCALEASAIVCVPILSYFNKSFLENFYRECRDLGFIVLNERGQKALNFDNFLYIKNKYSFGMSEHDILNSLIYIVNTFIQKELEIRDSALIKYKTAIEDKIYRSYNMLKSARLISYREAKNALLWLRVAVFYGILDIDINTINKMLLFLKKGHLDSFNASANEDKNYNKLRASYISIFLP